MKTSKSIDKKEVKSDDIKKTSTSYFGRFFDENKKLFDGIRKYYETAGITMFFRTYVSIMLLATLICAIGSLLISFMLFAAFNNYLVFLFLIFPIAIFFMFYSYPYVKTVQRKTSIEANLPFAINHMYAIAASGAPPATIFRLIAKLEEYGEISKEAKRIVRNIEVFGMDEITALKQVAVQTPSREFKDTLTGIGHSIGSGGNLVLFLREKAKSTMFDYSINKQNYNQTLSIYADLYTAILVAAPLIFVVILSVLSVLGGNVMGMPVQQFTQIVMFGVVPLLNVLFLAFIHVTQPKV